MHTVLIVDDVAAMAEQYAYDLRRLASVDARVASSGDEALQMVATENIDCMILDLEMPGKDGFAVLRALKDRGAEFPVIVYTGTGSFDRCVQAMRLGAYTFIDKADPVERVVREVETAIERRALIAEVTSLRRYAADDTALRGSSPAMQKLKDAIARVAPIPSPILVIGESGSGKELVARDIHRLSGRTKEPFIAVNCAALPEQLERCRGDRLSSHAELVTDRGDEVVRELRKVRESVSERRYSQDVDVEPKEQVLPEPAGLHIVIQVPVRRGDDTRGNLHAAGGAEPDDDALFQHAKQLRLRR